MTRLRALRNIVINHRLLYKDEIREIDPDVARHLLALHPDALEDLTPKPAVSVADTLPEVVVKPKPSRRKKVAE